MNGPEAPLTLRVEIVPAALNHADELARLHARLFEAPWDGDAFRKLLARAGAAAFIARVGEPGEAVGLVLAQAAADEAEILSLGVLSDRRRHGIATRLITAVSGAARRAEARKLHLEVAADNSAAIGLYTRLGFAEAGRRTAYYRTGQSAAEDALLLCLAL
jgi:ribosomal-protein-alanine N-acetyltransferase